jgi:predicted nucleic acid-binding protein
MRIVLDAGAFVAYEKGDGRMRARLVIARREKDSLVTTSPVVAQVWRGGRQALLASLLAATRVDAPDEVKARRAGLLLSKTKTSDVVDALVVGRARDGDAILPSDPDALRAWLVAAGVAATVIGV